MTCKKLLHPSAVNILGLVGSTAVSQKNMSLKLFMEIFADNDFFFEQNAIRMGLPMPYIYSTIGSGQLILDEGAVRVLQQSGRSLLPVGVTAVKGNFLRGEVVSCCDAQGRAFARGLVNYDAEEAGRIIGQPCEKIEQLLGYIDEPELIHRDNLVLL